MNLKQRKLREGNFFTPVCQSFCSQGEGVGFPACTGKGRGWLPSMHWKGGVCVQGGGDLHPGDGVCIQGEGSASRGGGLHPGEVVCIQGEGIGIQGKGVCI